MHYSEQFTRIPPEVWKLIFDNLKDSEDLYKCYQTCDIWRDILHDDLAEILFPLISSVLREYLPTRNFLKLRQVCKSWSSSVTKEITENALEPRTSVRTAHEPGQEWFVNRIGTRFQTDQDVSRFLDAAKVFKGNPFPNRAIILDASSSASNHGELLVKFTQLLKRFGKYIWCWCYLVNNRNREIYQNLDKVLKLVPFLKHLTIQKDCQMDDEDVSVTNLPELPLLKSLNLPQEWNWRLVNNLIDGYGPRLESCQFDIEVLRNCPVFSDIPVCPRITHSLRELKIHGSYGDSSLLENLLPFQLPDLRRLYLNYTEVGRRVCGLRGILQLANKCASTLEEIRLPCNLFTLDDTFPADYGDVKEFSQDMAVTLQNVKWLGVPYSYLGYDACTKIIRKFPRVEHIHLIGFDLEYKDKLTQSWELHQETDHFWEECKFLKLVTVELNMSTEIVFKSTGKKCSYF